MLELCPCGSALDYHACCGPFIAGSKNAPTPGKLMRSRFSAYAKHNIDYLIATWHPGCYAEKWRSAIGDSFKLIEWLSLTLVEEKPGTDADEGFVEFIAHFIDGNGAPQAMHERSRFLRLEQRWYYIDGIKPQPGRNATSRCGSKKKFEKCCGR